MWYKNFATGLHNMQPIDQTEHTSHSDLMNQHCFQAGTEAAVELQCLTGVVCVAGPPWRGRIAIPSGVALFPQDVL